jgi:hypothetical protein
LPAAAALVFIAFLPPLVLTFLVMLAISALPQARRLRGWYLAVVVAAAVATCTCGIFGAIRGLF